MRESVSSYLDPYAPPQTDAPVPLHWDRTVLSLAAFGFQALMLGACCARKVISDNSISVATLDRNYPTLQIFMIVCICSTFIIFFASTITKIDWPLHLRCCFIAIDLVFLAVLAYVSHGSGMW